MHESLSVNDFRVDPDWVDSNGHMNVACYVLVFDKATDAVYDDWDMGIDYVEKSGCSVFTLGMNVDYLRELFEAGPIRISTQLIGFDAKRLHYFHRLYHAGTGDLAATNECLCMHVNLDTRKSQPFPDALLHRLHSVAERHRSAGMPAQLGRRLRIQGQ